MKIYFTLDYEIYFGKNHGTVEKCMLYPASELMRIAATHDVRFVFFVDCGFIIKLDEFRKKFPVLEKDYHAVTQQVKQLSDAGHDMQLHIHPHWEDSYYDGSRWIIDVKRYKLSDFDAAAISDIVKRYKDVLSRLTGKPVFAYRAGGWCIQPFDKLRDALKASGIRLDSSVFRNGFFETEQYAYDFRNAPDKDIYRFEKDVNTEDKNGFFTELPISPVRNSPLFFWKLFLLGRWNPHLHKPLGDGRAMPAPGYRKKLLTRFTDNPVSVDGYNAQLLQKALCRFRKKKLQHMVVIGHPKALSRYSLAQIEAFVIKNKAQHAITTFAETFLRQE